MKTLQGVGKEGKWWEKRGNRALKNGADEKYGEISDGAWSHPADGMGLPSTGLMRFGTQSHLRQPPQEGILLGTKEKHRGLSIFIPKVKKNLPQAHFTA